MMCRGDVESAIAFEMDGRSSSPSSLSRPKFSFVKSPVLVEKFLILLI